MNPYRPSLLLIALGGLLLAGCEQKAETSVVAPTASEVAAASAAAPGGSQTLSSDDGVISLAVSGNFADKSAEAGQYIDGADQHKPGLLQYDEDSDIAVSITNFGAPKQPAEAYFGKLADSLRADQSLENTAVDAPADSRMGYRFSHGQGDELLNESCVAVYAQNIYNVCATSGTASLAELDAVLQNLTVKQ